MKLNTLFLIAVVTKLSLAASYTVPAPDEYAPQAIWKNISGSAKITNGVLTIQYALPEDLVGKNQPEITATGQTGGSFIPVQGENVKGTCMTAKDKPLTCMLKYPKAIVDEKSRDAILKLHFSGEELNRRSHVARLFSADPAGLFSVDLQ